MAKKKESATATTAVSEIVDETAVQTKEPPNLIGAAVDHLTKAVAMLRSKGGDKAESYGYIAMRLDHWANQLEKLNE